MTGDRRKEIVRHLSDDDLDRLLADTDDEKLSKRLTFVKNLYKGDTLKEAADRVGKSASTGSRWARRWNEGGLGLLAPKLDEDEQDHLLERLREGQPWKKQEIQHLINEEFDVQYHPVYLSTFLKELGLSRAIPRTKRPSRPDNAEEILDDRVGDAVDEDIDEPHNKREGDEDDGWVVDDEIYTDGGTVIGFFDASHPQPWDNSQRLYYVDDPHITRPPDYRKRGDSHPRSTVSFKAAGFKHDAQFNRVRLSKGRTLKEHRSDFVLCEYELRPDVDLSEWDIQQVRAVHKYDEWRLHFVCRKSIDPEPPGDSVAGIDLGISNVAALSFGSESILFPGNVLKEDEYHFGRQKAKCDDSRSNERLRLDRKRTERRSHFLHTLSKHIVSECVERGVGTIVVGDLGGIRDDENGESRNWGKHGNLDLHGWAFDRFTSTLDYKAEAKGIDVTIESERDTSKTCSACGTKDGNQRVERGLYVCEECDTVANADVNGAENIRRKVTPSPSPDRSNGWLAQPSVRLFDRSEGRFAPREQVVDCQP